MATIGLYQDKAQKDKLLDDYGRMLELRVRLNNEGLESETAAKERLKSGILFPSKKELTPTEKKRVQTDQRRLAYDNLIKTFDAEDTNTIIAELAVKDEFEIFNQLYQKFLDSDIGISKNISPEIFITHWNVYKTKILKKFPGLIADRKLTEAEAGPEELSLAATKDALLIRLANDLGGYVTLSEDEEKANPTPEARESKLKENFAKTVLPIFDDDKYVRILSRSEDTYNKMIKNIIKNVAAKGFNEALIKDKVKQQVANLKGGKPIVYENLIKEHIKLKKVGALSKAERELKTNLYNSLYAKEKRGELTGDEREAKDKLGVELGYDKEKSKEISPEKLEEKIAQFRDLDDKYRNSEEMSQNERDKRINLGIELGLLGGLSPAELFEKELQEASRTPGVAELAALLDLYWNIIPNRYGVNGATVENKIGHILGSKLSAEDLDRNLMDVLGTEGQKRGLNFSDNLAMVSLIAKALKKRYGASFLEVVEKALYDSLYPIFKENLIETLEKRDLSPKKKQEIVKSFEKDFRNVDKEYRKVSRDTFANLTREEKEELEKNPAWATSSPKEREAIVKVFKKDLLDVDKPGAKAFQDVFSDLPYLESPREEKWQEALEIRPKTFAPYKFEPFEPSAAEVQRFLGEDIKELPQMEEMMRAQAEKPRKAKDVPEEERAILKHFKSRPASKTVRHPTHVPTGAKYPERESERIPLIEKGDREKLLSLPKYKQKSVSEILAERPEKMRLAEEELETLRQLEEQEEFLRKEDLEARKMRGELIDERAYSPYLRSRRRQPAGTVQDFLFAPDFNLEESYGETQAELRKRSGQEMAKIEMEKQELRKLEEISRGEHKERPYIVASTQFAPSPLVRSQAPSPTAISGLASMPLAAPQPAVPRLPEFTPEALGLKKFKKKKANENFVRFGNFILRLDDLQRGYLNLRYPSNVTIAHFPKKAVSQDLAQLVYQLACDDELNPDLVADLSEKERNLFDELLIVAKVPLKKLKRTGGNIHHNTMLKKRDQAMNQLKIYLGEIEAGNDAPKLIKDTKMLALEMHDKRWLSTKDLNKISKELMYF